ncbi:PilZ domain-containing protein [Sphingosinicella ginsenosidimutans]|uniref:PilZ domain-containing protein n=1 Tax=Allosphingosinicella ginsenosidimutans TaxID=1176539 RepID=A0A5C6TUC9_9SPHN|nr:PilZ domain-containing protein [Sphingosinicella ginsenosidimutans]TXC63720.1 PilZ domain-containing protein [Sphingosinicella ginsenosidimutans]
MTDMPTEEGSEQRRGHRSNLFLAAVIEFGGTESPIRIRDLSFAGARLEGPAFPPIGSRLVLRRQDMKIEAVVRWIAGSRCGVAFDGQISVPDWVAGKASGQSGFGQAEVDRLQGIVRSEGACVDPPEPPPSPSFVRAGLDERLAQELAYVQRMLEAVSAELVRDAGIVARHGRALQGFDLADQILGHIAAVIKAEDREAAIRAIGMEELRARLLRKSL